MPTPPKPGETEKDFIGRCVPVVISEDGAPEKQAVAICYSMWDESKKRDNDMERKETIKTGTMYREANFKLPESIEEDQRSFEFAFSSEFQVERYFPEQDIRGMELLDHAEESIDLSRMDNAPLLLNHDTTDQIGVIENVTVQDRQMRGVVRFSKSQRAEEIRQDVIDGIRKGVSIGYNINRIKVERQETGMPVLRVSNWMPYEVSIVSIPADPSVGIGRSEELEVETVLERELVEPEPQIEIIKENRKMEEKEINVAEIEAQAARNASAKEKDRVLDITDLARKFNADSSLTEEALKNDISADEFSRQLLNAKFGEDNVTPVSNSEMPKDYLALNKREREGFSILRAVQSIAENGALTGYEKEISDEVAKKRGESPNARQIFVPMDVQCARFMQAEVFEKGGALVQEDVRGESFIELLRNKTVTDKLGVTRINNVSGNLAIPKQSGGATAYWLAEGASMPESDQEYGQVLLSPHRLGARTHITKQLMIQSDPSAEMLTRNDLTRVMAIENDRGYLNGSGASGEPLGLFNTADVNTVTFGGPPTWEKVVEFETLISEDNADEDGMVYVTTAGVRGKWKTTLKSSGVAGYLWEGSRADAEVNGYRAMKSQQIPDNKVVFGNWSDLLIASWSGMDITVDPYTNADAERVRIIVNTYSDCAVRHPESFAISTDAGNQ